MGNEDRSRKEKDWCRKTEENVLTWEIKTGVKRRKPDISSYRLFLMQKKGKKEKKKGLTWEMKTRVEKREGLISRVIDSFMQKNGGRCFNLGNEDRSEKKD